MSLPIVLITGQLLTDAVWQPLRDASTDREVIVADNRSDDCSEGFAQRLPDAAPPKFVLNAHGMGGVVASEVMRRPHQRVASPANKIGNPTYRARVCLYVYIPVVSLSFK